MRFVSVARQRNIYRVYSTTSAHVAPTASNHGNPRPDTRSCLSQITRERERTTKPLPISHTNNSSPVSKIVSNRYSKEKKIKKIEIIISYFRDTKRACLLSHLIGKLRIDRGKDRALFFFKSLFPSLQRRENEARAVRGRSVFLSIGRNVAPSFRKIYFRGDQRGPGRNRAASSTTSSSSLPSSSSLSSRAGLDPACAFRKGTF